MLPWNHRLENSIVFLLYFIVWWHSRGKNQSTHSESYIIDYWNFHYQGCSLAPLIDFYFMSYKPMLNSWNYACKRQNTRRWIYKTHLLKCVWIRVSYKLRHFTFNDNFFRYLLSNLTRIFPHLTYSRRKKPTFKKQEIMPVSMYQKEEKKNLSEKQNQIHQVLPGRKAYFAIHETIPIQIQSVHLYLPKILHFLPWWNCIASI